MSYSKPGSSQVEPKLWLIVTILVIGLLSYSSGAIFVRLAIAETDANVNRVGFSLFLSASRLLMASLLLIPAWRGFPQSKYPKQFLACSILAGVFLAIHFATWITSLNYTSIAASTALSNTHPVWITLITWIWLKERLNHIAFAGILIALAGSIFIGLGHDNLRLTDPSTFSGNILALIGGLSVGIYILLGRRAQCSGIQSVHHIALVYCTAGLLLVPFPILFNTSYLGHTKIIYLWVLLMALITQLVGHSCFTLAMKWVKPIPLSLVLLGEPLVASILGWAIFQEIPDVGVAIGSALVVLGASITLFNNHYLDG